MNKHFRPTKITCFKAYDIRGRLGSQLNEEVVYRIGRAYGDYLNPNSVVVGSDARATSEPLKNALTQGLLDSGVNVIDLGMTGTEEIYFATSHLKVDGGIQVTASHNPIDYNGLKLVRESSKPISGDSGLFEIRRIAESGEFLSNRDKGVLTKLNPIGDYIAHLINYVNPNNFRPLKVVANSGNGAAGHIIDALEAKFVEMSVPIEFIKIHHQPDSNFPNGIPNPLLIENRKATTDAVIKYGADFGIAWDGDFDRCFLFDEHGEFIEGYYIVGLLAEAFLNKNKGAKIIHDPRLTWNTIDVVNNAGGEPVLCKTGHAFIKERMREEDAIYGGEMSAHHYFRDFFYCDSGMIPWLLVAELLCVKSQTLSSMVEERIKAFPSSGEINSKLDDPKAAIERVLNTYKVGAKNIDYTDGISVEFDDWRFNLRSSNTEPVVRLNVESRGCVQLVKEKTKKLLELLREE